MLYLEDFLEVVEQIPQEMRDRTTDLRELDLGIQNSSDLIEDQIKTFFGNAKKMKTPDRDTEYEKIRKEYHKLLDDADEKLNIATNMHDLLERYMRKLDQELEKFKFELEADSPGITEVLEKRSLELDEPIRDNQKENRYHNLNSRSHGTASERRTSSSVSVKKEERPVAEPSLSSGLSTSPPPSATAITYSLGHMGAGSNAIAAAASQAIAATQQMQQGRRTASLKASYDAITLGVHPTEFSIGSELANAAQTALAASALPQEPISTPAPSTSSTVSSASTSGPSSGPATKKHKKKHGGSSSSSSSSLAIPAVMEASPAPSDDLLSSDLIDATSENPDWSYDPNEPRYCTCNQVSYGDMVACDNPKCPVEWFHYPCVGITAPPKGKWYCPRCAASMNRRTRK